MELSLPAGPCTAGAFRVVLARRQEARKIRLSDSLRAAAEGLPPPSPTVKLSLARPAAGATIRGGGNRSLRGSGPAAARLSPGGDRLRLPVLHRPRVPPPHRLSGPARHPGAARRLAGPGGGTLPAAPRGDRGPGAVGGGPGGGRGLCLRRVARPRELDRAVDGVAGLPLPAPLLAAHPARAAGAPRAVRGPAVRGPRLAGAARLRRLRGRRGLRFSLPGALSRAQSGHLRAVL